MEGRAAPAQLAALLAALVMMAAGRATADERAGLARLRQVSLNVEIAHPLRTMTAEDLTAHLVSLLRDANPPLTIHDGLADRIRLTISVRPMSATELRGFWLPFSGIYGIGAVRLGVERMVNVPGEPRPVPALVWQTERIVGSPWQAADRQIVRLVDEMIAELLEARGRPARE
jgi:hypothetical protein